MRAATVGLDCSRCSKNSVVLLRRCLNAAWLPTKPTLVMPSGSGIIQNQPSSAKWMLM